MKLKCKMEIIEIDGNQVAVPSDGNEEFRGVLHMNETASSIIELLGEDTTEDAIVTALLAEYDAGEEEIRTSVQKVLNELRENNLIEG